MRAIIYLGIVLPAAPSFAQEAPDWNEALKTMDMQSNFQDNDFSATMNMISEDPEDGISITVMTTFRRDSEDKFLMLTLEPENKKGQGVLRSGDNMWMYDPESRKFSHTSLKESLSGTDARNDDMRMSTMAEDYTVVDYQEGVLGSFNVWIVDLEAVDNEVAYARKKIWIDKKSMLTLKTEDYSLSNRLLRTSLYPSYAKIGDAYFATKMIFVDEVVEGKKTQISVTDISLDRLPDMVFQKTYIERVNQ